MARMPSGAPRSVPDPDGDKYEEMLRQWRLNTGGDPDFVLPINPLTGEDVNSGDDPNADGDPSFAPDGFDGDAAPDVGADSAPATDAWPSSGELSLLPRSPGGFDFDGALLPANAGAPPGPASDGSPAWGSLLDPSLADCAPGAVGIQQATKRRSSIGHPTASDLRNDHIFAPLREKLAEFQEGDPIGHPSLAESFIPFEGSGREALADLQEGDYLGAGVNAGLVALDFVPGEQIAEAGLKGAWKFGGSRAWKATRKAMGETNQLTGLRFLEKGQHGHHWGIPQNGWGKTVPNEIKNRRWNIKAMPSPEVHFRIDRSWRGKPRFNPAQRWWYGTPAWSKAVTGGLLGKSVMDAREAYGEDQ